MQIEYAKVSALGDRQDNQDRAAVVVSEEAALMLVFDGMGGHSDGARAAETGLQVVQDLFMNATQPIFDPQGFLYMALSHAHDEVVRIGQDVAVDFRPRATCAICLVQEGGSFWAHIGDSRIYQIRDGAVLTRSGESRLPKANNRYSMQIEYAKVSALGDRQDNQDRAAVVVSEEAALMLVFDGMGGHSDGARAAETGLQVVQDLFMNATQPIFDPQGFLYMALSHAHDEVVRIGQDVAVDFRPRATCAICLVQEGGSFWAHIGDSRIYQIRDGAVLTRSRDHSHVEVLIQEGAISEEEAMDHPMRNFVECCIGGDSAVPDMSITNRKSLAAGDVLLACSDGLWSGLSDDDVASIGEAGDNKLVENLKELSVQALTVNSPHSDNTTGAALRWHGS